MGIVANEVGNGLPDIDEGKRNLFDLIYSSNGILPIKELSEKVVWSSRQINRYFNQAFGISLKAYCTIFRFKSALQFIKNGQLYPYLNFTDPSHFIKRLLCKSSHFSKDFRESNHIFQMTFAYSITFLIGVLYEQSYFMRNLNVHANSGGIEYG